MTTRIKVLTGAETSSGFYGVVATDLGIPRMLPNGRVGYVFGDTWSNVVGGDDWRSPVMLYSDDVSLEQIKAGVNFHGAAGGDIAKQLWPYTHDSEPWQNGGFSTVLPSDMLVIDNRVYLFTIVCKGFPNVLFTDISYSDDNGETWHNAGPEGTKPGDYAGGMQQHITWEYDPASGYVFIFGTGFQRDRNSYLWRTLPHNLVNRDQWESWGWDGTQWGWGNPPSEVFPAGTKLGEMNLRKVQNNWVLTYLDLTDEVQIRTTVLGAVTDNLHTSPKYTVVKNVYWGGEWMKPGNTLSQPYGGYVIPGSTLEELHLVCSQWNTTPGRHNAPYRSLQFKTTVLPVNPIN